MPDLEGGREADRNGDVPAHRRRTVNSVVGGAPGGDAGYVVACQQAAYKCDTFDVSIAIFFAETQPLAEVGAHNIAVEYFNVAPAYLETMLDDLGERAFTRSGKPGKPDGEPDICHV